MHRRFVTWYSAGYTKNSQKPFLMHEKSLRSIMTGAGLLAVAPGKTIFRNLTPAELVEHALQNGEGSLADSGALMVDTGAFTGRDPKNKFFVRDAVTQDAIWWGDVNHATTPEVYAGLQARMMSWMQERNLYVMDAYACASADHRLNVRVVTTKAYSNLFTYNMFLRPSAEELVNFQPDFTVFCCPEFEADPATDGTPAKNFAILNMTANVSLVGGTGYTGEIKKGIFSVLNFTLPHFKGVLPMHCSANVGEKGDTAVFFGLSGTGKTTLSADPNRYLVGDDEHGWDANGIFNFEGGCYAKVINLSQKHEPDIWNAIRFGSILENTRYLDGTRTVDFANNTVTDNTRVSYPIHFIDKVADGCVGGIPEHIFFLTCDAYGVLPPISKLTTGQAMYHFMSGYTAKVAGTEVGITEPKTVFSACFGAPFMPLHPAKYAQLLGKKMQEHKTNVWLINTGWTGGPYGVGHRMSLPHTRGVITAALEGKLDNVEFTAHPVFGVLMPTTCPGVPDEILNPRNTWADKKDYDERANHLAQAFINNFKKFESEATEEMLASAPKPLEAVLV